MLNELTTYAPNWALNAISGLVKAINPISQVSLTIGNGVVNKIFYPREDQTCTREIRLIVTDGQNFFSDEKLDTIHQVDQIEHVPAFSIINQSKENKYRIEKEIIVDPNRDTVLQKIKFFPSLPDVSFRLFVVVFLSIESDIFVDEYKGIPMICAKNDGNVMAFSCSPNWKNCEVGNFNEADLLNDLKRKNILVKDAQKIGSKNTAILGEIDLQNINEEIILATGFGRTFNEAGNTVHSSLLDGFNSLKKQYIDEWKNWESAFSFNEQDKLLRESVFLLKLSESKKIPGAIVASPAIPWEYSSNKKDLGYRIVWPRDLVESAMAFLFLGANQDCLNILHYLMSIQESDGKWMQNYIIDGQVNLKCIQMDQIGLPIILAWHCLNAKVIDEQHHLNFWHFIKKAISYLMINGAYTQEGRWESQEGFSPYTMAVEITALLHAADLAEKNNELSLAAYLRETADYWNDQIEKLCYVTETDLSKEIGVEGYYVRSNPTNVSISKIKHELHENTQYLGKEKNVKFGELISCDALALVRYGLRSPHDPRILNTIKVIDAKLKTQTKTGPCWHRFNYDGYGEHPDGSGFIEKGIGRLWPLLTGERAHYEIAAGNLNEAKLLLQTMESFAYKGLFSEQIWDQADKPENGLFFGRFTGSAMPLIWAHAEYIKLCLSIKKNRVLDMPNVTQQRYIQNKTHSNMEVWRINHQLSSISNGKKLRIELTKPAKIYYCFDNNKNKIEHEMINTGAGIYYLDIPEQKQHTQMSFSIFWIDSQEWEKREFQVFSI